MQRLEAFRMRLKRKYRARVQYSLVLYRCSHCMYYLRILFCCYDIICSITFYPP
ncbi:hypothetical protein BCR43DRAFT_112034 [Syncephalastrum racemosum]|uniref:Uncharacterized protein n=1 Tax=Syncephalastrum racemosum TaxID=13706 RepID=A0A1X2H027_SYNRA|nr:hypothetical protein BCR43DRAFT_112034 [Syncephalastrum racemosum]